MKNKSITIHGINDELDNKLQQKSKDFKLSQNRTIKKILEDSLLIERINEREKEFQDLFGIWTKEEKHEFDKLTEDFDKTDDEDWQ
jgi:hypothetical protein